MAILWNSIRTLLLRVPRLREFAATPAVMHIRTAILAHKIRRLPDRRFFNSEILPYFAELAPATLLFVGCAKYTVQDYAILQRHTSCWTIDIDPAAAAYGISGRHIVGDIRRIGELAPVPLFDAIIFNGVLGWGLDSIDQMEQSIRAIASVLKPAGTLLVGWNTDKSVDPLSLIAMRDHFVHRGDTCLPRRQTFLDSTHVYDLFVKK